jgi:hypothetical protein
MPLKIVDLATRNQRHGTPAVYTRYTIEHRRITYFVTLEDGEVFSIDSTGRDGYGRGRWVNSYEFGRPHVAEMLKKLGERIASGTIQPDPPRPARDQSEMM